MDVCPNIEENEIALIIPFIVKEKYQAVKKFYSGNILLCGQGSRNFLLRRYFVFLVSLKREFFLFFVFWRLFCCERPLSGKVRVQLRPESSSSLALQNFAESSLQKTKWNSLLRSFQLHCFDTGGQYYKQARMVLKSWQQLLLRQDMVTELHQV